MKAKGEMHTLYVYSDCLMEDGRYSPSRPKDLGEKTETGC